MNIYTFLTQNNFDQTTTSNWIWLAILIPLVLTPIIIITTLIYFFDKRKQKELSQIKKQQKQAPTPNWIEDTLEFYTKLSNED